MSAPLKEERQKCWTARDSYWKCLENNSEDKSKCQKDQVTFEGLCSKSWVKYFERRRDYLKYSEKLESGYDPVVEQKS